MLLENKIKFIMNNQLHWNILLSDFVNKNQFIENVLSDNNTGDLAVFNSLKGILFSDITIQQFIEKEDQYDNYQLTSTNQIRKLRTYSAGEQKKEFLKHCLNQKPDYIILDNPFDHLDYAFRTSLITTLQNLSTTLGMIQLVNRIDDLLPFIKNNAKISDDQFSMEAINLASIETKKITAMQIPKSLSSYSFDDSILFKMDNVSVSYLEKKIVNSISWTVKQGEFWQLTGPNGSGKSTLLSMITGENPKGFGQELYLFGKKKGSGESVWEIKKNIGIFSTSMLQLFKRHQTVEQMILSGFFDSVGLYTQPTQLHRQIVNQWLIATKIGHLKNKSFQKLSLGLQRVVLIIRAVLKHPPLVILDEPLEGLDDNNAALVIELINKLVMESKMTLIYVSHRMETDLKPISIFELVPTENGSIGRIK